MSETMTRRKFLKGAAAVAIAAATKGRVPTLTAAETKPQTQELEKIFKELARIDLPSKTHVVLINQRTDWENEVTYVSNINIVDEILGLVGDAYIELADHRGNTFSRPIDRNLGPGKIPIRALYHLMPRKRLEVLTVASAAETGYLRPNDGRGLYCALFALPDTSKTEWQRIKTIPIALNEYENAYNCVLPDESPLLCSEINPSSLLVVYKQLVRQQGESQFAIMAKLIKSHPNGEFSVSQPATLVENAGSGYNYKTLPYAITPLGADRLKLTCVTIENPSVSSSGERINKDGFFVAVNQPQQERLLWSQVNSKQLSTDGRVRQTILQVNPETGSISFERDKTKDGLPCFINSTCITGHHEAIKVEGGKIMKATSVSSSSTWTEINNFGQYGYSFLMCPEYLKVGGKDIVIAAAFRSSRSVADLVAIDLANPSRAYLVSELASWIYKGEASANKVVSVHNNNWTSIQVRISNLEFKLFLPLVTK